MVKLKQMKQQYIEICAANGTTAENKKVISTTAMLKSPMGCKWTDRISVIVGERFVGQRIIVTQDCRLLCC